VKAAYKEEVESRGVFEAEIADLKQQLASGGGGGGGGGGVDKSKWVDKAKYKEVKSAYKEEVDARVLLEAEVEELKEQVASGGGGSGEVDKSKWVGKAKYKELKAAYKEEVAARVELEKEVERLKGGGGDDAGFGSDDAAGLDLGI